MRSLAAVVGLLLVAAAPPIRATLRTQAEFAGGPYCGIYCAYAALRSHGLAVRFDDLVSPDTVGSFQGSTAAELVRAAEGAGGKAVIVENLNAAALRGATQPVILHVRRPGYRTAYAHWVLFLGVEGGMARIVDPPHPVEELSFAELLSLWDGVGIVVGKESADTLSPRAGAWTAQATWLLVAFGGLALLRFLPRRWIVSLLALPVLALAFAAIQHSLPDGMIRSRHALGQVVGKHFEPDLPKVSITEAKSLHRKSRTVFLDARSPEAFKRGHIPGAVNLPIFAGLAERRRILETIKPGQRVVVYCQSEHCRWGESVAADLAARGGAEVVLYPGGWNEWSAHEPEQQ
ncbi:MAG: hypothetical protein K2W96_21430 [Gemmataceae bacterium]|nr:hypothetical protein [Gemmataceae bacterium]